MKHLNIFNIFYDQNRKSGRHSYWGVGFAEPIEGDCFGVGFYHVVGYSLHGKIDASKLMSRSNYIYNNLTSEQKTELIESTIQKLKELTNQSN